MYGVHMMAMIKTDEENSREKNSKNYIGTSKNSRKLIYGVENNGRRPNEITNKLNISNDKNDLKAAIWMKEDFRMQRKKQTLVS